MEVSTNFVDELEAKLRVGGTSTDGEFVTAVGKADPVRLLEPLAKRPVRESHTAWLAKVGKQ